MVKLQTITPMFGGSAETRRVDPEHPIRAASVRGHLRFWWRATAGAAFETEKELYDAESTIWGNTKLHGKVRIEVEVTNAGQEVEPVRHVPRKNGKMGVDFGSNPAYPAYALFPFQGTIKYGRTDEAPDKARNDIKFTLCLYYPADLRSQVETALHAWVMFGGIGSRTRRGCGSLQVVDDDARKLNAPTESPNMLTTLPASYFVGRPQHDALRAWADAVAVYRDFRQSVGFARNRGQQPNRPGRSRYPEPDTLRRLTNRHAPQHVPTHPVRGFPRADLGLPIIFHFMDERAGDPSDQTLQGKQEGKQRFASPIITKAAVIDGQIVPLVMVLDSPHVWQGPGVELKGRGSVEPDDINLSREKLSKIPPLNGLPIREAFKAFVKSQNFTEVRL
jgi:CRISPR-associated protein Cmr1